MTDVPGPPSASARLARALPHAAAPLATLLASAVCAASLLFGTHAATGADAFGYVSQSALWARGQTTWPLTPLLEEMPWPDRGRLRAPLGYGPALRPDTLAPTYSPGVPWLMAALRLVVGDAGPYLVTPLLGGLAVWVTFVWVRARSAPAPALAAALLLATSPPLLFQLAWPMSDVPVTAVLLLVLWRLPMRDGRHALLTGGLLALALCIRPNLVLAVGAVALSALWLDRRTHAPSGRLARALCLGTPMTLAVATIAALNIAWRGSPTASGYGAPGELFTWAVVSDNAVMQARWLVQTRAWPVALGVLALPWLALRRASLQAWMPGLLLAVAVWTSYVGYGTFTDWWYLRFQLPWWPVAIGAACAAVWTLTGPRWPAATALTLLVAAVLGAAQGLRIAHDAGIDRLWLGEQRYVAAGRWLREQTAPATVVLAVQHAGAVEYYGERRVLRFDQVGAGELDALVGRLVTAGHRALLVIDDWEEADIRARVAGTATAAHLDGPPLAQFFTSPRVRIYDLSPQDAHRPGATPTVRPPEVIRIDRLTPWQRLNAPTGSWLAAPARAWASSAAPRTSH